jgi:hypothetical protein
VQSIVHVPGIAASFVTEALWLRDRRPGQPLPDIRLSMSEVVEEGLDPEDDEGF